VNSWKVILATMVIFGTGVVTGGLLVRYADNARTAHPPRGVGAGRPAQVPNAGMVRLDFLRRAGRELGLTPDQHERLDKIIKDSQERTRKIMSPYMREELQRTRAEFREVLTPEQRPKFDALLKQQQQQQRARDQRHPPPPGQRQPEAAPPEPKK
jgi:Spy/CpxP family protein refolding chaperone